MVRTQSSPPRSGPSNPHRNGNRHAGPTAAATQVLHHQPSPASLKSSNARTSHAPQHDKSTPAPSSHGPESSHRRHPAPSPKALSQAELADLAFESGAWLFDASRVPAWLSAQLHPPGWSTPVKAAKAFSSGGKKQPQTSSRTRAPVQHQGQVIQLGTRPVRDQSPDIGFDSGAWLFDASAQPDWLSRALSPPASNPARGRRGHNASNSHASAPQTPPSPPPLANTQRPPAPAPAMSWAQVAASPTSSPARAFAARPPTKHRDPKPARSRSLPHRRTHARTPHHAPRASGPTTAASTTHALDLPTAKAHTDDDDHLAPAAYTLHAADPTHHVSLSAAHARLDTLTYAHRAAHDTGPVACTSRAAERVRDAMHVQAARALATFAVLCVVLSVAFAGLVARTGRPLVPVTVATRWAAAHGRAGHAWTPGPLDAPRWVKVAPDVGADGQDAQEKVIYM